MQVPLHPLIVHLPLALTFILPFLVLIFAYMIKINKMTAKSWLIIVGLQFVVVSSGYLALETGENEEHVVKKVLSKDLIHEHEDAAEIFVGSAVLALVLSIGAFFIRKDFGFQVKIAIACLTLISCYLAYKTGDSGAGLVYKHGAANAYSLGKSEDSQGILPTPGMNTSESPMPVNKESESLKTDDHDYGNADEGTEPSEDDFRQED